MSMKIITPNLTEACFLTDTKITKNPNKEEIKKLLCKLIDLGCKNAIVTGIVNQDQVENYYINQDKDIEVITNKFYNHTIHGAGDVFSSCCFAAYLNNKSIKESIKFATCYLDEAIKTTIKEVDFENKGIVFEPFLNKLMEV